MATFIDISHSIIYFAKLIGIPVLDENQRKIGTLHDFFVNFEETYPSVIGIQFLFKDHPFYVCWDDVETFSYKKICIKDKRAIRYGHMYPLDLKEQMPPKHLLSYKNPGNIVQYPGLAKVILDKQVVDTYGKKVVRINDIHFQKITGHLRLTYVSIGLRSMLRRLGYEDLIDKLVKILKPNSLYLSQEQVINWKNVQAIPDRSIQKHLQLNIGNEELNEMHPADLADILEELDSHGRQQIFKQLNPEAQAAALSEIEDDKQLSLLSPQSAERIAEIIENMGTDEAADLLKQMSDENADHIISKIQDDEVQEEIQELLDYPDNKAGGIMSTEILEATIHDTKESILTKISAEHEDLETIHDIYVLDEQKRLIGTCSLFDLLSNAHNVSIKELMEDKDIKALGPDAHWKEIAEYMSKYNLITVPIWNHHKELLGIVSVDDILPWLLGEH